MDIASRATYRGQITKLAKSAMEYLEAPAAQTFDDEEKLDLMEEELNVFLSRLKAASDNLKRANSDVSASLKPEDFEREAETIAEYDDKALTIITRLKQRLTKVQQHQNRLNSTIASNNTDSARNYAKASDSNIGAVKLPKLQLRKFSGDAHEWIPFWEQYKSVVHENQSLTAVDKFNYLQSALCGRATETIAGLTPTKACYESAVSLLNEEYGNTDKIVDMMMQRMLSVQHVSSKTDVIGLRRMYNHITSCTRSLTALGISSDNYFIMLKGVLLRCLPYDLRVDFHRHCIDLVDKQNSKSDQTAPETNNEDDAVSTSSAASATISSALGDKNVRGLLKFLKREVESLEKAYEAKPNSHRTQTQISKSVKAQTAVGLFTTNTTDNVCLFCRTTVHSSKECDSAQSLAERKQILKGDGRCFRCCRRGHNSRTCRNRNVTCKKCNGRHASSMCDPEFCKTQQKSSGENGNNSNAFIQPLQKTVNLYTTNSSKRITNVFLQTAYVFASNPKEKSSSDSYIRIIMDGGSQLTYVKSSVARKLKLPVVGSYDLCVFPFGSEKRAPSKICNVVMVRLRSQHGNDNNSTVLEAIEIPEICVDVLSAPSASDIHHRKLQLADARLAGVQPEEGISLLVGADTYWKLATGEHERITDKLVAINTLFGWTLQGPSPSTTYLSDVTACHTTLLSTCACDEAKQIWELETLGIKASSKPEGENIFQFSDFVKRVKNRFVARLPWKNMNYELDSNRDGAFMRLNGLVRKLSRQSGKLAEYDDVMQEMISNGIAEKVSNDDAGPRVYYMPHRPVYRCDKSTTRMRIVFDASAHAFDKLSLNEHLEAGDNLLPDILKIMLNFRCGKIALVADIEKAFLQVILDEADRDSHRFFWFSEKLNSISPLPPIHTYRMTRVTFGVTSSPFLLGATINEHLNNQKSRFPEVCTLLQESFYMDDLVTSVDSEELAREIYRSASYVMQEISMILRKWNTNNANLRSQFLQKETLPDVQNVLGIKWFTLTDELTVNLEPAKTLLEASLEGTKRNLLKVIGKIYDPLGVLGPFTVRLKIIFQTLWRMKVDWDERLSGETMTLWSSCCEDLLKLTEMTIPRYVGNVDVISRQLHVFADSSLHAFGAVAYIRQVNRNGAISTQYLCSKNRVAPLKETGTKEITLPKLELTAALVASRLANYLCQNLKLHTAEVWLWSDSKITLYWITGNNRKWKPYVHNRVKEIQGLTSAASWRHCPGPANPADMLTRGVNAQTLLSSSLWLHGPDWLSEVEESWPDNHLNIDPLIASYPSTACLLTANDINIPTPSAETNLKPIVLYKDFSAWSKLLRTTAYVFRFISLLRGKSKPSTYLTSEEVYRAENYWIEIAQIEHFKNEISLLRNGKGIPSNSKLITLNPFLDEAGLLRVGGRLQLLNDCEMAHPIILPKSSHLTMLLVTNVHEKMCHGGSSLVLSRIRQKFWIPQGRQLIRTIMQKCTICRILRGKPMQQPFAPLPRDRFIQSRPFEVIGLDFAGPLYAKTCDDMKRKVYIMLFTCAAIRAVHLELTPDLTSESCLLGFRRFIARRGIPRVVYSDNAKTFKKASLELRKLDKFVHSEELHGTVSNLGITWKFIVERAPWWGGFWERLVGVVKSALRAVIRRSSLDEDQLRTLLVEVESVVNERPLTFLGEDPHEPSPLTPAHFLQSAAPTRLSFPYSNNGDLSGQDLRLQWKQRLRALNHFRRRWHNEYLQQLRSVHHANKGNFSSVAKPGDVVLMHDSSLSKFFWRMAVIEEVYPGRDGKIRSCLIRLSNGTRLKRPVQRLYPIEMN